MKPVSYYHQPVETLYKDLTATYAGLSQEEAVKRQEVFGLNQVTLAQPVTLGEIFLEQFKSPLIYILFIASAIVFLLGDFIDGSIIAAVILLNATIGTFQEGKARDTLSALQTLVKGKATVLRDGVPQVISEKEVVPGDILIVKDGDMVAADARLIEANTLQVNESALTGESTTVLKEIADLPEETQLADRTNMIFRGTFVFSGVGRALVVSTGAQTTIGTIAKKLDTLQVDVPLKENIKRLSRVIIGVVVFVSLIIFIVGVSAGNGIVPMFVTVVAVAVSAIPESLPVVVTLVLATGVFRMTKRNVLVKRLQAVEALGQAKVLALDKTGTITKNQMMVEKIIIGGIQYDVTGSGYEPKGVVQIGDTVVTPATHEGLVLAAKIAAFTATAHIAYDTEEKEWKRVLGDPTEVALLVFAEKIGLPKRELERQYPKVFEIPFDFRAKHHTTVNDIDGTRTLSTSGSPEVVLQHATTVWEDGQIIPMTEKDKKKCLEEVETLSKAGYRVLALAMSTKPPKHITDGALPELTFVGFVGISDAIRSGVLEAVEASRGAGMKVVMITGDHVETARTIAERVGIYHAGDNVLTGADLDTLEDAALDAELERTTVFARVSPDHKLRIIESYKRRGETIAMTGDGINDALSLTAADLGVAMGKVGTEVAREAADLIILDDNFDNIRVAVEEGRSMYQTIRMSVLYLLSTNIGELLVIAVAVLLGWPLPLLATQIIWLNMVTDTFLVAALALEPKQKGLLSKRFSKPSPYLVDWRMGLRIILIGSVMTFGTLILFKDVMGGDMTKAWTIALTMLTVFQWFNIWNVRSGTRSVFGQNPFSNPWLVTGLLLSIGLHMVAIYTPTMQSILHTTGLSWSEWSIILMIGVTIVVIEEIRKFIEYMLRLIFRNAV